MSPIVEHPDVQAMLLRMKALTAASRSICYACAHAIDMSRGERRRTGRMEGPRRPAHPDRQGLLNRCRHRGRLARHSGPWRRRLYRGDRRGTTSARCPGLCHLRRDERHPGDRSRHPQAGARWWGRGARRLVAEMRAVADEARRANRAGLHVLGERLSEAIDALDTTTDHMLVAWQGGAHAGSPSAGNALSPTVRACSRRLPAHQGRDGCRDDPHGEIRVAIARHFVETMLAELAGLSRRLPARARTRRPRRGCSPGRRAA